MHIFIPKNLAFCQPSPVGEGGSRRLTDEVSIMLIALFRHAHIRFTPAHLFLAGVQTMCARICSAFSCDMFARVVCLRLRRAAKLPTCVLSFVALTRHAWLARLTRARGNEPMHAVRWLASPRQGRRFLRGWKILLNDFCR